MELHSSVYGSLITIGGTPVQQHCIVYLVGTCCGTVAFLFPDRSLHGMLSLRLLVSRRTTPAAQLLQLSAPHRAMVMMLFGAGPLLDCLASRKEGYT